MLWLQRKIPKVILQTLKGFLQYRNVNQSENIGSLMYVANARNVYRSLPDFWQYENGSVCSPMLPNGYNNENSFIPFPPSTCHVFYFRLFIRTGMLYHCCSYIVCAFLPISSTHNSAQKSFHAYFHSRKVEICAASTLVLIKVKWTIINGRLSCTSI